MPKREFPLLLGEWFDRDPMVLLRQTQFTGAAPNVSVAYTINGQPGDLYRCSSQETVRVPVEAGETILLRIINSALNQELYFAIANHRMTVVATDAAYAKPFPTNVLMIGPGQTINVLVTADQTPGRYYMAARAYQTAMNAAFDNTTTTAILEYKSASCGKRNGQVPRPILPALPAFNDTATATAFTAGIRGLSKITVFRKVDVSLYFIVGLGLINCTNPNSPRCQGPNGTRFTASINNNSFVLPTTTSLMQAYYQGIPGVFTTDFPPVPPLQFNYTGNVPRGLWTPSRGTKLYKLKYGSNVQIVLQDTSIVTTEDHPMHIHGFHFFIVGSGFGNFNPATDPARFNLVDPPVRNTIGTPPGGWVAIRFVADNPGIWFLHCHIDSHLNWGLATALLVENGVGPSQSVIPPPADLPQC
ncbi:Laccase-3 protein [Spatholobus suberectus]|nr:Laccase-3 protein [Spatholobus suberectus]